MNTNVEVLHGSSVPAITGDSQRVLRNTIAPEVRSVLQSCVADRDAKELFLKGARMRLLLAEILRAIGVRHVFEAGDGAEALQIMRTHQIDVVMTDYAMPHMTGLDLCRAIRADGGLKHIPVVLASGEAVHAGVVGVIHKIGDGVITRILRPRTAVGVYRATIGRALFGWGVVNVIVVLRAAALEGVIRPCPVAYFVGSGIT